MSTRPKSPSRSKTAATVMRAFLFSDLRDSTAFVERHGDVVATKLIREYRALVRREVARHQGAEVKTEGDSFLIVFERPSVALECAVAIQKRAEARNAAGATSPLRVGMGLHAGEVVPEDDQYVGSVVNIAARLAGKAEAGEIVISDTLRGLVRTAIGHPVSDRGPLRLKGVAERVRAWRVEWGGAAPADRPQAVMAPKPAIAPAILPPVSAPAAARRTGQLLCPTLVGRDVELAQVDALLEQAGSGVGATLVVGGDAGVGKSALLREAQARATARGFRILVGVTHESSAGLPYGPFVDAVRSGFRGLGPDRLGRFLRDVAPAAAQLFPEVADPKARPEERKDSERHLLSVSFREVFRAFAREGPLLVIVEDLHWADEASLDILQDLTRELRDAPVLILATYRSDEMHRRHPFLRTLTVLQRERLATIVRLHPLTQQDLGELIRLTFAREDPVSAEFLAAIYSRSEGNPYFSEELLKVLVESGEITFDRERAEWTRGAKPVDEMRIPDSIVDAVRARVDRSSAEARLTLGAAAVIGLRIPFDVLRAVRQLHEADLEAQLRELIEQQLLAEHAQDEDAYAFRHALTREVVYDDLLGSERKRLHRATADTLASSATTEPALLAHHLIAAGDAARAVPYLLEAADRALAAGAPRDSVAHYERALAVGVDDERRQGVLEHLAEAYGRFDEAKAAPIAQEAVARARALGDRRALSRALGLAAGSQGGDGAKAEALMLESIEVLAGEECVELARAKARLAHRWAMAGHTAEATALADEVSALGERLGDPYSVGRGLAIKAVLLMGADRHNEALAVNLRARDLLLEAGHPDLALGRQSDVVFSMMFLGRPVGEMEGAIAEGFALATKHGIEIGSNLASHQALLLVGRGEWDRALDQPRRGPGPRASVEAMVALGRSGPEASLPHRLIASDASIRSGIGYVVLAALIGRVVAFDRVGDMDQATETIERLREQIRKEPAPAVALGIVMGSANVVAMAVRHEQSEWLDRFDAAGEAMPEAEGPDGAWGRLRRFGRLAVAAGRALLAGDAAACAAEVTRYYDATSATEESAAVTFAIDMAREARRRELPLGPEWRPLVERCRTFAERAKAVWWLSELDALEAAIS